MGNGRLFFFFLQRAYIFIWIVVVIVIFPFFTFSSSLFVSSLVTTAKVEAWTSTLLYLPFYLLYLSLSRGIERCYGL